VTKTDADLTRAAVVVVVRHTNIMSTNLSGLELANTFSIDELLACVGSVGINDEQLVNQKDADYT